MRRRNAVKISDAVWMNAKKKKKKKNTLSLIKKRREGRPSASRASRYERSEDGALRLRKRNASDYCQLEKEWLFRTRSFSTILLYVLSDEEEEQQQQNQHRCSNFLIGLEKIFITFPPDIL
mmetsp:Transcript_40546/g.69902  ORF Transcript_40546/g.69902 Transcript_40546/m.69902 type:complete len:121 (+) Transcript_40546:323-685(+)